MVFIRDDKYSSHFQNEVWGSASLSNASQKVKPFMSRINEHFRSWKILSPISYFQSYFRYQASHKFIPKVNFKIVHVQENKLNSREVVNINKAVELKINHQQFFTSYCNISLILSGLLLCLCWVYIFILTFIF